MTFAKGEADTNKDRPAILKIPSWNAKNQTLLAIIGVSCITSAIFNIEAHHDHYSLADPLS
jgi:hypothetical protein